MDKWIISIDPAGKGTTGICICKNINDTLDILHVFDINKKDFKCVEKFWEYHLSILDRYSPENTTVIIEDFILDPRKARQFYNSDMPTSKLVGTIQTYCYSKGFDLKLIKPYEHKHVITDDILCDLNYMIKTSRGFCTIKKTNLTTHTKDALRMAVYINQKEK